MSNYQINFNKSVSAIIPLHNKEATIVLTLDKLKNDLKNVKFEIVIIENSSTDNSYKTAESWCIDNPEITTKLIRSNKGLGNALKAGIENSSNDYIWTVSPDMQFGVSDLVSFIDKYNPEIKLYIGSRLHEDSNVVRGVTRKYISKAFNFLKKIIINSDIQDTMGSFIGEAKYLKKYYLLPKTTKFFFVTELIAIFEQNNHQILEIPVETFTEIDLHEGNASTVNFLFAPLEIFFNLIILRFRIRKFKLD